jgi:hypothetical protein
VHHLHHLKAIDGFGSLWRGGPGGRAVMAQNIVSISLPCDSELSHGKWEEFQGDFKPDLLEFYGVFLIFEWDLQ